MKMFKDNSKDNRPTIHTSNSAKACCLSCAMLVAVLRSQFQHKDAQND